MDAVIARLAAKQHGVFSRAQARSIGATRGAIEHRLTSGRWSAITTNVFEIAGTPTTWERACMAAVLAWGDASVISHAAAGRLWALPGCERASVEVTVPPGRNRAVPVTAHRSALESVDVTARSGIPVTTVGRTLIDLAARWPIGALEEALDDALRRGLITIPRARARLNALARNGRPGITAMRQLLAAREPAGTPQSVFETRLRAALRRAGLPEPVTQYAVRDGGRVVAVVDFAYPDACLAVEADGYRWHSGRARFEHDRARRNRLTLLGWRVIHVTWQKLDREPGEIVAAVRAVLDGR